MSLPLLQQPIVHVSATFTIIYCPYLCHFYKNPVEKGSTEFHKSVSLIIRCGASETITGC